MRSSIFRILAVALLALAIPLQGVAAVTAGQCMALEHHDAGDAHDHAAHADGDDQAVHHDDSKTSHCGPCAACCASATMSGPAALPILSSATESEYFFSQFPPLGIQPEGLDRPPLAL